MMASSRFWTPRGTSSRRRLAKYTRPTIKATTSQEVTMVLVMLMIPME